MNVERRTLNFEGTHRCGPVSSLQANGTNQASRKPYSSTPRVCGDDGEETDAVRLYFGAIPLALNLVSSPPHYSLFTIRYSLTLLVPRTSTLVLRTKRMQLTIGIFGPKEGVKELHMPGLFHAVAGAKAGRVLSGDLGRAKEHIPQKEEVAIGQAVELRICYSPFLLACHGHLACQIK